MNKQCPEQLFFLLNGIIMLSFNKACMAAIPPRNIPDGRQM